MMIRHKALLIGTSNYRADPTNLPRLRGPLNDVAAMHAALTHPQKGLHSPSDVIALNDPTKQEFLEHVQDFFSGGTLDEQLLFYYSGHGERDLFDELYLCATDTKKARLVATGVSDTDINKIISGANAGRTLIVLDCCYSGAFRRGHKGGGVQLPRALTGTGRYILTSSLAHEKIADAQDGAALSPFTKLLTEAIVADYPSVKCPGYVTVDEVYDQIRPLLEKINQTPARDCDRTIIDMAIARAPVRADVSRRESRLAASISEIKIDDVQAGEELPAEIIYVYDQSGGSGAWRADVTGSWLSIKQNDDMITVEFCPRVGRNRGTIFIRDTTSNSHIRIPIEIHVSPAQQAEPSSVRRRSVPPGAAYSSELNEGADNQRLAASMTGSLRQVNDPSSSELLLPTTGASEDSSVRIAVQPAPFVERRALQQPVRNVEESDDLTRGYRELIDDPSALGDVSFESTWSDARRQAILHARHGGDVATGHVPGQPLSGGDRLSAAVRPLWPLDPLGPSGIEDKCDNDTPLPNSSSGEYLSIDVSIDDEPVDVPRVEYPVNENHSRRLAVKAQRVTVRIRVLRAVTVVLSVGGVLLVIESLGGEWIRDRLNPAPAPSLEAGREETSDETESESGTSDDTDMVMRTDMGGTSGNGSSEGSDTTDGGMTDGGIITAETGGDDATETGGDDATETGGDDATETGGNDISDVTLAQARAPGLSTKQRYDLAKAVYSIDQDSEALEMMGELACELGVGPADWVYGRMTGLNQRTKMRKACASHNIDLKKSPGSPDDDLLSSGEITLHVQSLVDRQTRKWDSCGDGKKIYRINVIGDSSGIVLSAKPNESTVASLCAAEEIRKFVFKEQESDWKATIRVAP